MSDGYRDDLAAARARVAQLEAQLAEQADAPDLAELERNHAALVRSVPAAYRVRLLAGLAGSIVVISLLSIFFLSSPYDHHPRFQLAMQMLTMFGLTMSAVMTWVSRAEGLRKVALSERWLAAERARAALESRVRVAERTRVAAEAPAELEFEPAASARAKRV